jgi:prepilin-type N-terminal cleavage/methylation domain-containing protein
VRPVRPLSGGAFPPKSRDVRVSSFRRRVDGGFTLVELMIVVVILTILSAIAIVGWRRWIARARTSEAVAMLSEMMSKEQSYFLEFGRYLPLRGDNDLTAPSANENGGAFYPSSPDATDFESSRTAVSIANANLWPGAWRSVGLRPRYAQLFCTYIGNAGATGQAPPAGGMGTGLIGATTATSPAWFYALAACNLNGQAGYPGNVTVLGVSTNYANLATFNDGR